MKHLWHHFNEKNSWKDSKHSAWNPTIHDYMFHEFPPLIYDILKLSFGPEDDTDEVLHQTQTHVPVSQFLIHTSVCPKALRMTNLFQSPVIHSLIIQGFASGCTHQAAPTTDREMARPMPRPAHMKGDVSVRNLRVKTETKHSVISLHSR